MVMRLFSLLFIALSLSACVSTQPASLDTPEARTYVTERGTGEYTYMRLDGEKERPVKDLRVYADSTVWVDRWSGEARAAPTSEVEEVTFRRTGTAPLRGAGFGAINGLLLHILIPEWVGPEIIAPSALGGAVWGVLIGSVHGLRDTYRFPQPFPQAEAQLSVCPGIPATCALSPAANP